jgi:hypothetical protein
MITKDDQMPFGNYTGRALKDVPGFHLLELYHLGVFRRGKLVMDGLEYSLRDYGAYVEQNMEQLEGFGLSDDPLYEEI